MLLRLVPIAVRIGSSGARSLGPTRRRASLLERVRRGGRRRARATARRGAGLWGDATRRGRRCSRSERGCAAASLRFRVRRAERRSTVCLRRRSHPPTSSSTAAARLRAKSCSIGSPGLATAAGRGGSVSMNWSPSRSPAALAEDVRQAVAAGADGLALYNLSLVPEAGLEAFRAATLAYRATLPER